MGFIDWHRQRSAIDLARRCVHDTLGAVLPRRLENIQGAKHVRFHIGLRSDVRMRYRDQCSEMKYDFVTVHEPADESGIADIAADDIYLVTDRLRQVIKPAMAVERVVLGQSRYL